MSAVTSSMKGGDIVGLLAAVARGEGTCAPTDWIAAEWALAALPLTTSDYGLCRLTLRHARQYLKSGEPGAAAFEVRMLLGRLTRLGLPPAAGKCPDR